MGHDLASEKSVSDISKIERMVSDELPKLRETILASQGAIINTRICVDQERNEVESTRHLLDLSKKKVRILEEELEKSLETT